MSLPLFSPKLKHWITLLIINRFSSTLSPPLPPPYKRHQEPHNSLLHPFLVFLWVSLAQELILIGAQKSSLLPLLLVRPHPSLWRPELRLVRSMKSPSSSLSIHGEPLCITATACSNSGEFLLSQVTVYSRCTRSIFQEKNIKLYTNTLVFFEKLRSNTLFGIKFDFRHILKSHSIVGLSTSIYKYMCTCILQFGVHSPSRIGYVALWNKDRQAYVLS
jgi:hypothetical protein